MEFFDFFIGISVSSPMFSRHIIFPLIFTSMDRIDTVSNAMELRGFGKHKKRTWYMGRRLAAGDYVVMIATLVFMIVALVITYYDGNRFYNPFV